MILFSIYTKYRSPGRRDLEWKFSADEREPYIHTASEETAIEKQTQIGKKKKTCHYEQVFNIIKSINLLLFFGYA